MKLPMSFARARLLASLVQAALLSLAPHGATATESLVWESFAHSPVAYYLFNSTSEGRAIFEAVTALPARRARDLTELSSGLLKPEWRTGFKPELESRLLRIQSRFSEMHGSADFLSPAQQSVLGEMAREELGGLQLRSTERYEFFPIAEEFLSVANDNASAGFLARVWHDGLSPRLGELAHRWTGQVELIANTAWGGTNRSVLFVSTHGLPRLEAERLVADAIDLLAPATISFPTAVGGQRMTVRLGGQWYDFRGRSMVTPFGVPTRTWIDPVAIVALPERVRLSQYLQSHPLASALDGEARISPVALEVFDISSGKSLREYLETAESRYRAPLVIVWTPDPIAPLKARLIQN